MHILKFKVLLKLRRTEKKPEDTINYGQFRDTDNIGHNTQNWKDEQYGLHKKTGMNPDAIIVSKPFLIIVRFSNSMQHGWLLA